MRKTIIIFTIVALAFCSGIVVIPSQDLTVMSANLPQSLGQQLDGEPAARPPKRLPRRQASGETAEIGEAEKDDPLARADAEYRARGRVTPAMIDKHLREARRQRDTYPERFSAKPDPRVLSWKSLGPTSDEFIQNRVTLHEIDSGRLRTILPHPSDPDIVYVLSGGGGLWKSTNFTSANHKWRPLTDSIGTTAGGSVAFGSEPNTLYLGTGDPWGFAAPGGFMVTTRNGGNTWSDAMQLGDSTYVLEVKVDGSGPNNDVVLVGTERGLYRSDDSGKSFNLVAFADQVVWSLVQTSAGWLASVQHPENGDLGVIGLGPSTLYLSNDRGQTWAPISNAGNGFSNAGRTTLAVGASGDAIVYAFAATPGDANTVTIDQLDLFRSLDGGQTWIPLHITTKTPVGANQFQPDMDLMFQQAFYNQLILVDPSDPSSKTVYLGGQLATAKTTDGGDSWRLTSDWLPTYLPGDNLPYVHADCHTAAFSQIGGTKTVFFGTDGGLAISQDGGATWDNSKNKGLVDQLVYSITASAIHPEQSLIGLQDLGTRFRTGNSTVWNQVFGGDGLGVGWSQANDNVSLATLQGDSYFRVLNNPPDNQSKFLGANFFFQPDYFAFFSTPVVTPSPTFDQSGYIFVTYTPTFIYFSFNRSGRWATLANIDEGNGYGPSNIKAGPPFTSFFRDLTTGLGMSEDTTAMGICMSGGRVALSTDNQNTWFVINLNSEVADSAAGLGFHGLTGNVLWTSNSDVYVTSVNGFPGVTRVVRSNKGGITGSWSAVQNGLPDVPVSKLISKPHEPNTIFAATDLGVYQTTDGGDHWSLFGANLPQVQVRDLYIAPDGSFLRIATYGRGVWEIGL